MAGRLPGAACGGQESGCLIAAALALGRSLKERRLKAHLSQVALAKRLHSSQSRVAKMESGDPGVSMDLLTRSLLALGASPNEVAKTIAGSQPPT
jgi:transcriptional regulator with XRE-family HTH domain